ncbi:hypothetical protein E2562_013413 [Oryza meyeriana var. granulata]|uniref:Uncharacterized protein n=1 Tax=Oryza meyeriana var. granulata TaxID=110450 RepID=A0A6G1EAR6_9ORYZ|nr:hypothetical protein E2562_013413 [Oryza meyeriana var. granulata]
MEYSQTMTDYYLANEHTPPPSPLPLELMDEVESTPPRGVAAAATAIATGPCGGRRGGGESIDLQRAQWSLRPRKGAEVDAVTVVAVSSTWRTHLNQSAWTEGGGGPRRALPVKLWL